MADLTLPTSKIIDVYKAIQSIDNLSPPMAPKARYVLNKVMIQVEPVIAKYDKERIAAANAFAKREDGKIVSLGDGKIALEDPEAYREAEEKLLAAEVTITGTRLVTRVEVGACPLTQFAERVLLGVLIADEEPA